VRWFVLRTFCCLLFTIYPNRRVRSISLIKSHRPQPCSFCHSDGVRALYRPNVFEFRFNFTSENWVRLNSPLSTSAVCWALEKLFLSMGQFTVFKISVHFRKRNRCSTTLANTKFHAEHEYGNRLVKFTEMENILGV
jgi:hypothetical protein